MFQVVIESFKNNKKKELGSIKQSGQRAFRKLAVSYITISTLYNEDHHYDPSLELIHDLYAKICCYLHHHLLI